MKTKIMTMSVLIALLPSCKGTWLMYDTDQKDHIYFQEQSQVHAESFALISSDDITVTTNVYVMGMLADHDRTYEVEYVSPAEGETYESGSVSYPVIAARPGVDFSVGSLTIPAGEVSTTLDITLHRQPEMSDSCYVKVGIKLKESDEFDVVAPDSTRTSAILSPVFYVYVTDGEPACPAWWRKGKNYDPGWNSYLGKYTAAKFRMLLDLYHATEETSPVFYEYCIAQYGYYLKPESDEDLNKNFNTFWCKTYANAWAKYVFGPLYDYYLEYYASLPEGDPEREDMGTVNANAQTGWGSPWSGTYGFLN